MEQIKLKTLRFETPAFRKLGAMTVPVADRITLIAGHNGIGKSTILALIANGSGVRGEEYQTYLNRPFEAFIYEIIHLDHKREFEDYKANPDTMPSAILEYDLNGEPLSKRCAITDTKRKAGRQVRVVPRNLPYKDLVTASGRTTVGKDAKVQLPTIYLGMTRMLPVGESNPDLVTSVLDTTIHQEDAQFIHSFTSKVIGGGTTARAGQTITTQGITGTRKTSKHPHYAYSSKCVSLGQDSLSAIATALASFNRLKREWPDYPGGLLVVDELDAGFHPRAQEKLINAVSNAAKKLNLQVVATTHSLCLIEAIHPEKKLVGPGGTSPDRVIYITDTHSPRIAEGYTLDDIKRDMSLIPPPTQKREKPKVLKIYLEDAEADFILRRLLTLKLKRRIKEEAGVSLKSIPISMGCDNLKGAYKHDPYFKTVLIAVDADSPVNAAPGSPKHIIQLPGAIDARGRGMSPERTIYAFIYDLISDHPGHPATWTSLNRARVTSDYLQELIEGDTNIDKRESAKSWMISHLNHIGEWRLFELWMAENPNQVRRFEAALIKAAIATSKLAYPN
jgi:energy-coupling factor transporter ATP-binding protein EcfA2